ncbi:FecR domain-containing protein [Duganella sp. sic0402]|uniref:FecR family protein n=1 Tax=Duganella sp. sic0402 TaxID=2854786 RepID=UPI001C47005C|nr:FecR domain-containing protein [Duganella sp. sic0402]MBV7536600.1 FecR domain-containing protein [Duganella sp. sic0402]
MTPPSPQPHPQPPAPEGQDEPWLDESPLDELSPLEFAALHWSVRVADGLDSAAQCQFDAWLAADPAHRTAYNDMAGIFDEVDALPASGAAHLSARVVIDSAAASAAADLQPRRPAPTTTTTTNPPVNVPQSQASAQPRRAWLQPTLTGVIALVALGAGWSGYQHWQRQPVFEQYYATARGQQLNTELPDGSRLQLDTATRADVTLYRDRRRVRLAEGQAVFKVHGDKARPFDVEAGPSRITVVGTKFSVRYLPSGMQVAVMEGKVRVAGAGEVRFLLPGQTIRAGQDGQLSEVTSMPVDAMASWLSGRLSVDNAALSEVLAELARYGDTGLQVHDEAIGRLAVTASVNLRDPQGFARSLSRVLPVKLRPLANGGTEIVAAK